MRLFKKLRRKLSYLDADKIDKIESAFKFAFVAHQGQSRNTGEPYITHPVAVAVILAELHMDAETIIAALLHDVIEDTAVSKSEVASKYGQDVADIVDGVSKLTRVEGKSLQEYQAENFRKMVLAMARDIRVILVKLADRLHNMRTLSSLRPAKRRRIACETLEIYAPIAKRLGMRDFSVELEELSFAAAMPSRYKVLSEAVKRVRGKRLKVLNIIQSNLQEALVNAQMPSCAILGREKHIYSIYRKMKNKRLSFNEIMDVYAFRMIVDSVDQCYRVLGLVHRLFKPVPERFKDYIAIPKVNGYQSLHTTLFGPFGLPIEIQIRTAEMDRMAVSGIAAHWLYKTNSHGQVQPREHAQKWVQKLLDLQKSAGSSLEFIESVKLDLFPEDVYVFTPKGDIKQLPTGATAVDFAYSVHTNVGHSCVGVKIDRQISPLSMPLSNGQTIEIITSPTGKPNPSWLDMVVTSKARSSLRHYFKSQRTEQAVSLGSKLLHAACAQHNWSFKAAHPDSVHVLLEEMNLIDINALYADIGLGNRIATFAARRLLELESARSDKQGSLQLETEFKPVSVSGTEGMVLEFAECCCPIPGDPIVGLMRSGTGVEVHRESCAQVLQLPQQDIPVMSLRWAENYYGEYIVRIVLSLLHEAGALARISLSIADLNANIEDFQVVGRNSNFYTVSMHIAVRDRAHLARIIASLHKSSVVHRVQRD